MRVPLLRSTLLLTALLLTAESASAVIMKLTPLAELLENEDYLFVAKVDAVDPAKPGVVFKVEKKLKGEPPYERIPVNMTGNAAAKKADDTKTILDRLDPSRKVVFFVSKSGKNHNAMAFVEGSWFSVHGIEDPADKVVRWSFQNGEPYLRRTFKGTSDELIKVIEDGLAKKAKPPAPNEKEKEGYGPPVDKKKCEEPGSGVGGRTISPGPLNRLQLWDASTPSPLEGERRRAEALRGEGNVCASRPLTRLLASSQPPSPSRGEGLKCRDPNTLTHPSQPSIPLFGVIPSVALLGPMALVAALFPGVFAKMAIAMKRWRAFLTVASINSTLALVYWLVQSEWPTSGWWTGPRAFTLYLMAITATGLGWAGRRYRRMAAEDPSVTNPPARAELYTLAGLTAFAGLSALLVAWYADWQWRTNLELPMREFTFIGLALLTATAYAAYRAGTRHIDIGPDGKAPDRRLSISGEMVGLAAMLLCGFTVVISGESVGAAPAVAGGTESGDAEAIGPRFVEVKTFEIKKASEVMSGITIEGDRLYFGTRFVRSRVQGNIICVDRNTGEEKWRFGDDEQMKPVFSTPTVVGGMVYCGEGTHEDNTCRLFCVNAASGVAVWKEPITTTSHTEGAPAVVNGKVIFPAGDDGLIAVDVATRAEVWRLQGGKEAGIHIDAAPAVSGNRVFVGSGLYGFDAFALDADTRRELWRKPLGSRAFGAPLALGKFVYFGVGTGNLGADVHHYKEEGEHKDKDASGAVVCLNADTGEQAWRLEMPRSVHSGLAGDAFSIYAGARDGHVYAIDRKTGKLRWKTGIGQAITSRPAVATAEGVPVAVYAVSREGNAACLNPHTGKVVWQKPLPGYRWIEKDRNFVLSGPVVVTTPTPTGSKRTVYVGGMTVDPDNDARKTAAVFRFVDEIGGE